MKDDLNVLTFATKEDLLKAIAGCSIEEVVMVGYVDENGDIQSLKSIDFQFDKYGRLITSKK